MGAVSFGPIQTARFAQCCVHCAARIPSWEDTIARTTLKLAYILREGAAGTRACVHAHGSTLHHAAQGRYVYEVSEGLRFVGVH